MLQFSIRDRDADDRSLRRLLKAYVVYQRMAAAKKITLELLAFVGVPVWVGAMWPTLLPLEVVDSALAVWISLLVFAASATVEEWLWHGKVARYRDEHQTNKTKASG